MTFASDARYRRRMVRKTLLKNGVPPEEIDKLDLDTADVYDAPDGSPPGSMLLRVERLPPALARHDPADPPPKKDEKDMTMTSMKHPESESTISCVLVVTDEALLRKERIEEKLRERGLRILRTYPQHKKPTGGELADVGCLCVQAVHSNRTSVAAWKAAADQAGARFFLLFHQVSGREWRTLEEWVGGTLTGPASRRTPERAQAKLGDVVVEGLRKNLKDAQERATSLEERLHKAEASLEALTRETKAREERYSGDMSVLFTERDGLRDALTKSEQRLESVKKSERTAIHNLGLQRDQHVAVIAAKDAEVAKLVAEIARLNKQREPGESSQAVAVSGLDPDVVLRYLDLRQEGLLTWSQVGEKLAASAKKAKGT